MFGSYFKISQLIRNHSQFKIYFGVDNWFHSCVNLKKNEPLCCKIHLEEKIISQRFILRPTLWLILVFGFVLRNK